jgi:hypothetical protein
MTTQEFVSCLRREVLEANLRTYRNSLESSLSGAEVRDAYWRQTTELYRSLSEEDRRRLIAVIRQVVVDTLSNVLGILDGSTLLEKHRDYFHLTYGDQPHELNGELQDLFLAEENG